MEEQLKRAIEKKDFNTFKLLVEGELILSLNDLFKYGVLNFLLDNYPDYNIDWFNVLITNFINVDINRPNGNGLVPFDLVLKLNRKDLIRAFIKNPSLEIKSTNFLFIENNDLLREVLDNRKIRGYLNSSSFNLDENIQKIIIEKDNDSLKEIFNVITNKTKIVNSIIKSIVNPNDDLGKKTKKIIEIYQDYLDIGNIEFLISIKNNNKQLFELFLDRAKLNHDYILQELLQDYSKIQPYFLDKYLDKLIKDKININFNELMYLMLEKIDIEVFKKIIQINTFKLNPKLFLSLIKNRKDQQFEAILDKFSLDKAFVSIIEYNFIKIIEIYNENDVIFNKLMKLNLKNIHLDDKLINLLLQLKKIEPILKLIKNEKFISSSLICVLVKLNAKKELDDVLKETDYSNGIDSASMKCLVDAKWSSTIQTILKNKESIINELNTSDVLAIGNLNDELFKIVFAHKYDSSKVGQLEDLYFTQIRQDKDKFINMLDISNNLDFLHNSEFLHKLLNQPINSIIDIFSKIHKKNRDILNNVYILNYFISIDSLDKIDLFISKGFITKVELLREFVNNKSQPKSLYKNPNTFIILKKLLENDNLSIKFGNIVEFALSAGYPIELIENIIEHPKFDVNGEDAKYPTLFALFSLITKTRDQFYINQLDKLVRKVLSKPELDITVSVSNTEENGNKYKYNVIHYIMVILEITQNKQKYFTDLLMDIMDMPAFNPNEQISCNYKKDYRESYIMSKAIKMNRLDIIQKLLSNPSTNINTGYPIYTCIFTDLKPNETILKLLLTDPRIDVNRTREEGKSNIYLALENGHEDAAILLLNHDSTRININELFNKFRKSKYEKLINYLKKERGIIDVKEQKKIKESEEYDLHMKEQGIKKGAKITEIFDSFKTILKEEPDFTYGATKFQHTLCPFCLTHIEKEDKLSCLYLSGHRCPSEMRNEKVMSKYLKNINDSFDICVTCGRPSKNHGHYSLTEKGELNRYLPGASNWDCNELCGGGDRHELLTKIGAIQMYLKKIIDQGDKLVYTPELNRELVKVADDAILDIKARAIGIKLFMTQKWNSNTKIPKYLRFNVENVASSSTVVEHPRNPMTLIDNTHKNKICIYCREMDKKHLYKAHDDDIHQICTDCIKDYLCSKNQKIFQCFLGCSKLPNGQDKIINKEDINDIEGGHFCN